jgi:hypothetical protein
MDTGLTADTAYRYRVTRADGSVAATADARTGSDAARVTPAPQTAGDAVSLPFTTDTRRLALADGALALSLPAGAIEQRLAAILCDAETRGVNPHSIGVFSSLGRDDWASVRARLEEDAVNRSSLDTLDNALFVVCLDRVPVTSTEQGITTVLYVFDRDGDSTTRRRSVQGITCSFTGTHGIGTGTSPSSCSSPRTAARP